MEGRSAPIMADPRGLESLAFECPMCMESVGVDLRVYPCQHFGCMECIARLPREIHNPYIFKCPECRRLVNIPPEGLPPHRDAQRINEQIQRMQNTVPSAPYQYEHADEHTPLVSGNTVPTSNVHLPELLNLVKNDTRCDLDCNCHTSCRVCGLRSKDIIEEVCNNVDGNSWSRRSFPILLLPIQIFCLMKAVNPCCAVFNPQAKVQREPEDVVKVREDWEKEFLSHQLPVLPHQIRQLWPIMMIVTHCIFLVTNIYHLVTNDEWIFPTIPLSINSLLVVMWVVFTVFNFTLYKPPADPEQVTWEGNSLTFYSMEKVQLFLAELGMYPQMCVAAMLLPVRKIVSVLPFTLSLAVLLTIFAIRTYALVKLRKFTGTYFVRLMLVSIGNYLVSIFLVVILVVTSFNEYIEGEAFSFVIQLTLSALIIVSNPLNMCIFYVAHLYEVSLQACLNMLSLNAGNGYQILLTAKRLMSYEPFHKNLYTMSSPSHGVITYFWIFPPVIAVIISAFTHLQYTLPLIGMYCGYFFLLLLVNHKALLLTMAAHFTLFVIALSFLLVCLLSLIIAALFYTPIVVAGVLLIIFFMFAICCFTPKECCLKD